MGRFSWLGGHPNPREDAKSIKRARTHKRHATKTDRAGWQDHDKRDRRLYGG
ncbi:hypothetical protein [Actinacidiphila sp. ITFR-21]|uniref:hypothetical protein n=1 Tax=Actinacidiphila sp. ITFR-21 TaxID=3075199 RepID=UPI002889FDF6|nr:hypothetical protein [Streptomyces sp. ITFR-21]WNI19196.1 hypothetical protein RLT57_29075 [Streptomyces sp. ITFR-21]